MVGDNVPHLGHEDMRLRLESRGLRPVVQRRSEERVRMWIQAAASAAADKVRSYFAGDLEHDINLTPRQQQQAYVYDAWVATCTEVLDVAFGNVCSLVLQRDFGSMRASHDAEGLDIRIMKALHLRAREVAGYPELIELYKPLHG